MTQNTCLFYLTVFTDIINVNKPFTVGVDILPVSPCIKKCLLSNESKLKQWVDSVSTGQLILQFQIWAF